MVPRQVLRMENCFSERGERGRERERGERDREIEREDRGREGDRNEGKERSESIG